MKNFMIFILLSILMVSSPFYSEADEKVVKKENIKKTGCSERGDKCLIFYWFSHAIFWK